MSEGLCAKTLSAEAIRLAGWLGLLSAHGGLSPILLAPDAMVSSEEDMGKNILAGHCGSLTDNWPQEAKTCGFALLRLTPKLTASQVHCSIKPSPVLQTVSYLL